LRSNTYKRVLSVLAAAAVILSLYACNGSTPNVTGKQTESPEPPATPSTAVVPDETPSGGTEVILYDLSYGDGEINKYDLYIPAGASKEDETGVILYIHGGSWTSGSKADEAPDCERYAKAGYITASMNYTLAGTSKENTAYKMLDEIQACVAAIKDELTDRGYNVTKMAIGGASAGGHLASLYAYSKADVSAIPVVLLIDLVGPSDMHAESWGPGLATALTGLLTGREVTAEQMSSGDAEELINSISPVHFVNGNSCASILAYGGQDALVGKAHHEKLTAALEEAGVDYSLLIFPNSGHSMDNDSDKFEEYVNTVKTYLKKYFGY
jgi:acetyl esterase/lipase